MSDKPMWTNLYSSKVTWILFEKKWRNASDLMAGIALLGPSTTWQVANFVVSKSVVGTRDVRTKDGIYRDLINARRKKSGKKIKKESLGLLSKGYLFDLGTFLNEKNLQVHKYFLTLKGCLFAFGFDFSDLEFRDFVNHASRHYLFFAYLKSIMEKTSIRFVREIFQKPIQALIKKNRILLDYDFALNFVLIAEKIGESVYNSLFSIYDRYNEFYSIDYPMKDFDQYSKEYIELIKNTWYDGTKKTDWIQNMKEYYYPHEDDYGCYLRYADDKFDPILTFKVMDRIHHGYHSVFDMGIPSKHKQKLKIRK